MRGLNPYEEMPKLNMFTYRMGDIVMAKVREGVEIDGDTEAYAFDLNEFFRVDRGKFVHDEAIDKWLDALSRQPRYPFSTPELRHELRHTFWLLNRVDAAKKLAEKLRDIQRHPEFADFEIVVAAGDGKTDNDEVIEDEGALRRVRKAIADHPQGTITLSVGQLTTGVSVREWTGVLILSNMKSPAQYMQAAFRAQTPYLYKGSDGQFHRKENAYIFDFDPARTLTNYEEMANGLSAETASGGGDADTRKQHVRELLNFFPVIGEDEDGEMMELDAEQVMLIPRKIRSQEVVRSGFMSNFLFANISSIYGCSAGIINIINQFDAVSAPKNGMVDAESVEELSGVVDEDGNTRPNQTMVKEVQAALFGPKIYGDKEAELGDLIAHSIEKYSEKKEKQGKSAEEQLIDHVSSQFFDEVVFNDSVKEFMKLRRRLADYFEATSDEDIFNYIPPQKTNQIFTPKKVVRKMVDLLEEENPGCFDDPDKTFVDLYMKSGQYITEIVKRLYNSEGIRRAFPNDEERLRHIFKHQVYGLAPTECIYRIALRYIQGFDDTIHIAENEHHLRFADSLPAAKASEMETFLDSVFKS
ncbi:hypothetical protein [Segatella salivae]|uniref:hypothetical protein n=1 Tax=Segatella salivae TaxID=228604 RepID=UPI00241E03FC|nr:hypothetical protein [Segatella salivae]